MIAAHHSLRQALSDDAPFVEIETAEGAHAFLLKREIARQILRSRDVIQRITVTPHELDQYLELQLPGGFRHRSGHASARRELV